MCRLTAEFWRRGTARLHHDVLSRRVAAAGVGRHSAVVTPFTERCVGAERIGLDELSWNFPVKFQVLRLLRKFEMLAEHLM